MKVSFLLLLILLFVDAHGQNKTQKLKVFIDCKDTPCDNNFIRTEITLIDFVLNRLAADVHVLITSAKSGNGGNRIQYTFFGQNEFKSYTDTLTSRVSPNATDVEVRSEITNKLKLGLIPFFAHSPLSNLVNIDMKGIENRSGVIQPHQQTTDKWDYWIFNVGADGTFNIDQNYKNTRISGNASANRTTDKLKASVASFGSYDNASYRYELDGDTSNYVVINSTYGINHKLFKSISDHWSAGYEFIFVNNTFSNIRSQTYFRPAIEYAIFPYRQVNNKFFTINYGVDIRQNRYYETTIYDKTSEVLWGHKLQSYLSIKQKWGNVNSSVVYSNFFNNRKFNNLALSLTVNVRVTGGLFFYVYSKAGLTRDQVYLIKGKASEQDVLVRRRQLASGYNFYSGIGLSYRFGSILNNFVNPRFDQP